MRTIARPGSSEVFLPARQCALHLGIIFSLPTAGIALMQVPPAIPIALADIAERATEKGTDAHGGHDALPWHLHLHGRS